MWVFKLQLYSWIPIGYPLFCHIGSGSMHKYYKKNHLVVLVVSLAPLHQILVLGIMLSHKMIFVYPSEFSEYTARILSPPQCVRACVRAKTRAHTPSRMQSMKCNELASGVLTHSWSSLRRGVYDTSKSAWCVMWCAVRFEKSTRERETHENFAANQRMTRHRKA